MRVLLSWLREFVDVPDTAERIARTMSVRGFAVEGLEPVGEDDAVIDFEVTANRPDCLCVAGIAREVATAYGLPLRVEADGAAANADDTPRSADIAIAIENADLCPRYAGAVADVTVSDSPAWMRSRLQAAGVRPISSIVDVTNYVLLELGQPMHAFDLTTLAGAEIRVRTAKPGERLKTLDGQVRDLAPSMLVIADATKASAVAGVMGGADSEVTGATRSIVLESAYFDPLSVRRTSKALGLKTEASIRFERGADPSLPVVAMRRALALLDRIGAGRLRGPIVDCHPAPRTSLQLRLRRERIAGLLGAAPSDDDTERILAGLDFSFDRTPDGWNVVVPPRRVDVRREVDLVEEVARHYGFDRLPVTFPAMTSAPKPMDPRILRDRRLRAALTAEGFHEAVTFGFIARAAAVRFASEAEIVPIANPLSESFAVLRPSALPGLVDAVAHNRRREQRDVRLFEVGGRFSRTLGERRALGCAWTGAAVAEHWAGGSREVTFFDLKGVVERVVETAGVEADVAAASDVAWLAPGRAAEIRVRGARVGLFGQLAPEVADAHGLPTNDAVYVADIDLDSLEATGNAAALRVKPLPRFPSISRDISVLVSDGIVSADLRDTIRRAAPPMLVRIVEFDRYAGKGIPDGQVSVSLHLTFRSPDRTLTDAEVQQAMEGILGALRARHGASQR